MVRCAIGSLLILGVASTASAGQNPEDIPGGRRTTLGSLKCSADQIAKVSSDSNGWECSRVAARDALRRLPVRLSEIPWSHVGRRGIIKGGKRGSRASGGWEGFRCPQPLGRLSTMQRGLQWCQMYGDHRHGDHQRLRVQHPAQR